MRERRSIEYLNKPAPDPLLLIVAAAGSKPDSALAASTTPLQFDHLTGDRIPQWIAHHAYDGARNQDHSSRRSSCFRRLWERPSSACRGARQTRQLCRRDGEEIGEDAVAAVVGVRRGETQADLLDAVADRNVTRSLELIPHVLAQPKTTGVSIVMALSTQMLAISWGRARLDEGVPEAVWLRSTSTS